MTTLTPKVKWAERPEVLYVTVEAPVANPNITIESNKIKFEGKNAENTYAFEINLFKEIDPKESKTDLTGRYPKILLKKVESGYWNFLIKEKKNRFVETDWTLWKDEDEVEEDDTNKFGDFGGMGGMPGGMDFSQMMSSMGGMGGMPGMGDNMDDLNDEEEDEEEEEPKNNEQTEETKLNSVD